MQVIGKKGYFGGYVRALWSGAIQIMILATCLHASSITCSFNGGATTSTCYGSGLSFTSNDGLDLYSAFGSAQQAPFDMNVAGSLNGTTTGGVGVQVSLGPGGNTMAGGLFAPATPTHYLMRSDNTLNVWATDGLGDFAWDFPGDPGITPAFNSTDGHFNAPTAHVVATTLNESTGAWGDFLLGPSLASGSPAVGTMVINFNQGIAGIGFQISSVSGNVPNTNFIAEMDAYNGNTLLGSYLINAAGSGGTCPGLNPNPDPVPCNDAPLLGFTDAQSQITRIVIYAKDSTGDKGFEIGNLFVEDGFSSPVPEPAGSLLVGAGILLICVYARKRFAAAR